MRILISTKRFILVILILLVSAVFTYVAAAQVPDEEPAIGPSGLSSEDESAIAPDKVLSTATIVDAKGGVDVTLGGRNEPAVAVHPTNANNIIVARLFAIRVSTDGGLNFTAATQSPLPAGYTRSGDPSVAFDSQGRLFWTYLGTRTDNGNIDVFISQVNPATGAILAGYPVNVTAGAGFPASGTGNCNDKEWLAADRFSGSPFLDQLYVVWTRFTGATCTGPTAVHTTFSTNQGLTWSAGLTVSAGAEGFVWPSHNAVATNGDVYVSYHSQPTFTGNAPNGTSGQVFVLRSTDGGATYPQKGAAFTAGNADITFNVQTSARTLNQSASWTQGSAQAWVLPDPLNPNNVYVVANDDPTNNNQGAGFDDMDVFIIRSTNQGVNWSAPAQIDAGPTGTTQFFPTAGIDDQTGCIAVTWYDTRTGATNTANNFLLDLFMRSSSDGGLTFSPAVQVNDVAFDPDLGAGQRFPGTLRIGEYNGVALSNGLAHAVWTGNTATGQQIMYDNNPVCASINVVKEVDAQPDGVFDDDPSGWTFDVANDGQPSQVTDNTGTLSFTVQAGIYDVNETAGPNGLWLATAVCVDDSSGATVGTGVTDAEFESPTTIGVTGLPLSAGQSVTCTFSNEKDEANINIVKEVDAQPDGIFDDDPAGWTFDVFDDGEPDQTTDSSGVLSFVVRSGTYDVKEISQPVSDTGLWLVTAYCADDSDNSMVGTGVTDILFGPTLLEVVVTGLDLDADQSVTCTFENQKMAGFVTGGGHIRTNKGKNALRVNFGGNLGVALDGSFHGQWQTNFTDVSNSAVSGTGFHSLSIDSLLFGNVVGEEPDPPDAVFNGVEFATFGRLDGQICKLEVMATDHGEPARGKNSGNDSDSIQIILDCPDNSFDYDSANDFENDEGKLHNLDGGNLQIHPPRE